MRASSTPSPKSASPAEVRFVNILEMSKFRPSQFIEAIAALAAHVFVLDRHVVPQIQFRQW